MSEAVEKERPRLVILLGPTGVGKSRVAIELAEEMDGEIINADSMQVYRYMDIGTAKPTSDEQKKIQHHLIDLVTPDQPFHAGLYRTLGRKVVDELHKKGTPIFIVGGTGLYIKALIQGLFASPPVDPGIRNRLKHEGEEKGGEVLYQRLIEVDPETASRVHPRDFFRIIRALEVFKSTGIPISFFRGQHRFGDRPYRTLKIGLEIPREKLYQQIDERVEQMIEKGFLEEVRGLLKMGYEPALKPMQSLGYKQMTQFFFNQIKWSEAIHSIKRETRRYAKRQWTWFRADKEIRWRDASGDWKKVFAEIKSFLREP